MLAGLANPSKLSQAKNTNKKKQPHTAYLLLKEHAEWKDAVVLLEEN